MSTNNLPECLRRKLVFGDKEQIEALKKLEQQEEEGLKEYQVTISFSGKTIVNGIMAKNESHAENIVNGMDLEPDSITVDYLEAEEVKP